MQLKKMVAGALGALMVGSSVGLAATLADYPAPFAQDGNLETVIVVGSDAKAEDVIGAANVGARLAGESYELVSAGAADLDGAVQKEVTLGANLSTDFGTMKDNKLAGFVDSTVSWNDKKVDVEETLTVDGVEVLVSDTDDEDFGAEVVLGTTSADAIVYKYIIDDSDFNSTNVDPDEPIYVDILGETLKITGFSGTNQITYEAGKRATLGVGDSVEVDGKTITVKSIGQDSIAVDVDGESEIVTDTASNEEVGDSGIKVTVEGHLYDDNVDSRQVDLLVGSETSESVTDGNAAELFGEPDSVTDAEWVWHISETTTDTAWEIGLSHNKIWDADGDPVLSVGDSLALPNDYATVTFNRLTGEADLDYTITFVENQAVHVDASGNDLSNTRYDAIKIEAGTEGTLSVTDNSETVETDVVYFLANATADSDYQILGAYLNADGRVEVYNTSADLNAETVTFTVAEGSDKTYTGTLTLDDNTTANVSLSIAGFADGSSQNLDINNLMIADQKLGSTEDDAETDELQLNGNNRGTRDHDVRTVFGNILRDPENNGDKDQVKFSVTGESNGVEAVVTTYGPEDATTTSSGETRKVEPVKSPLAKLDVNARNDVETKPSILVGGPCVNSLVQELANADKLQRTNGNETTKLSCPNWTAMSAAGDNFGVIALVEDAFGTGSAALVVAGSTAKETAVGTQILQDYESYADKLKGHMVEFTGTTLSTVTFKE